MTRETWTGRPMLFDRVVLRPVADGSVRPLLIDSGALHRVHDDGDVT
jgi:hypothetical protein